MKFYSLLFVVAAMLMTFPPQVLAQNPGSGGNYGDQGGTNWHVEGDLDIESGGQLDVESGGEIDINAGGTLDINGALLKNGEVVSAANVITTAECGSVYYLNSGTEFASTLPSPTVGCGFEFVIAAAPSGADYTVVTTGAETIKGLGFESEVDTGDDGPTTAGADTVSFKDGVAVAGDRLRLDSDGSSWFAISFTSADGGITFSSAI